MVWLEVGFRVMPRYRVRVRKVLLSGKARLNIKPTFAL